MQHNRTPVPPRLLPLLAGGGGPRLFRYLAVSRPRKGFLEPLGGSLGLPLSPGDGIRRPFFAHSLGATRGSAERTAAVKIARAASIVPALIRAAPDSYLSSPLWAGWMGA